MPFDISRWIWLPQEPPQENQWINVHKTFNIKELDSSARLCLAVDTDYVLWLNGRLVATRAFSDFPEDKTYDSLEVAPYLQKGENALAILAWFEGKSFSRYRAGRPGMIFDLQVGAVRVGSDKTSKVRLSPSYKSGPVPFVTPQLGLTIECDARGEDGWEKPGYDDRKWGNAKELAAATDGFWRSLRPRPIPKLILGERLPVTIVDEGAFTRAAEAATVAATVYQDQLNSEHIVAKQLNSEIAIFPGPADGHYLILDFGRESFGYVDLEITAPAGTVVDIAHGEHLIDGRTRCAISVRNFADRYICGEGRQQWLMPMRALGCRYLELHFTNFTQPLQIHYAGLRPADYPVARGGDFRCSDELYNRIYDVAVRTLELSMHEHYEDCPWREQSLYAMDSKNQALCGYNSFGEYDFPGVAFALLGRSIQYRHDQFLELCAPAEIPITIPCFSMAWMVCVRDHLLYSGRTTLTDEFYGQIKNMLSAYLGMRDGQGLMPTPMEDIYWNFYEWQPGLDDGGPFSKKAPGQTQSCLNLFLLEALEAVAQIAQFTKPADADFYRQQAAELRPAIARAFAIGVDKVLPNHIGSDVAPVWAQLPQALALEYGVLTGAAADTLRRKMVEDPALIPATLSMTLFVYEAMLQDRARYGQRVLDHIAENWGYMLKEGASSFWETIKGAADFDNAGSLCHGWSAIPVYIYQAYILGIKPLEPGFKRFAVNPLPGRLARARGTVPTPSGPIHVAWEKTGEKYQLNLRYPEGLQAEIQVDRKSWIAG